MLIDTLSAPIAVGLGNEGDSASFEAGIDCGGWEQKQDSLLPRTMYLKIWGDSGDSLQIRGYHHATEWDGTSPTTIGTWSVGVDGGQVSSTTFSETILPPGFVWFEVLSLPGTRPKKFRGNFGYSEKRAN
jgi:hypothetical protein